LDFGVKTKRQTTLQYDLRSAIAVKHPKETIHQTFSDLFETLVQISVRAHYQNEARGKYTLLSNSQL